MGQLTGSEKGMLFLAVLVLVACTVLAFLLGYVSSKEGGFGSNSTATTGNSSSGRGEGGDDVDTSDGKYTDDCPPCPTDECLAPVSAEKRFNSDPSKYSTTPLNHNYVVSIIVPMYSDSRSTFMYVCTGVIISNDQVLTGGCGGDKDIMEMSVRSGSQYWHTGGSVHKITAVTQPRFKASGLYILGVTPPFTTDAVPIPVIDAGEKWTEAEAVGWTRDARLPKRTVQLDSTVQQVTYESLSCHDDECATEKCDDTALGHPLITNGPTPKLVGIVSGRGCSPNTNLGVPQPKFTDITAPNYYKWIQEMKHTTRRMFNRRRYY